VPTVYPEPSVFWEAHTQPQKQRELRLFFALAAISPPGDVSMCFFPRDLFL